MRFCKKHLPLIFFCFASLAIAACGAISTSTSTHSASLSDAVVDEPFGKWAIDSTSEIHGDMLINANGTGEERVVQNGSPIQSSKFKVTIDKSVAPKRMLHVFDVSGRKVYCLFERQAANLMKLNCSKTAYPATLTGGSVWHTY